MSFQEHHFPFHYHTPSHSRFSKFYLPASTSLPTYDEVVFPSSTHSLQPPFVPINSPSPSSEITNDIPLSPNISTSTDTLSSSTSPSPIMDISLPLSQSPTPTPTDSTIRKSTRISKAPSHLTDYVCSTAHWCNVVHFSSLSVSDQHVLGSQLPWKEPTSYKQAILNSLWVQAMDLELQALQQNNTWDIVPLPVGKKPVGCKWVYKIKLKADGSLERCKARLVAKGYTQEYGVDFLENISPVVRMTTIRCIIAIAASKNWVLHHLNINNAFLHGDLHEDVYMKVPDGLPHSPNMVCKLKMSLYGLKQASRQWFSKLSHALLSQGFIQSKLDYSLFTHKTSTSITIVAVYVDDMTITGDNPQLISQLKAHLHATFSIKDLGRLHFFLGLEASYSDQGIILTQCKFTHELLRDAAFPDIKPHVTPLPLHYKMSTSDSPLLPDPTPYRCLICKLNFLTNTRPNLSYSVQSLSQHMQQPRVCHLEALKHTLGYISHTLGQGILLTATDHITLQAYSDSDWVFCLDTRRSISGFVLLLGRSPISWKSKKQATVSKSSSEAEYRSMATASAEVVWVIRLLDELGIHNLKLVTLNCDNMSALHIANNPVFHERTKHIEVDCHFTRDKVMEGLLQLTYLPTQSQIADVFTKILPSAQFQQLLSKLGMHTPPKFEMGGGDKCTSIYETLGIFQQGSNSFLFLL